MKKIKLLSAALLLLSLAFFISSCDDGKAAETEIISAEVKNGEVTVKATLDASYAEAHSGDKLYLIALSRMDPEISVDGGVIVSEVKTKSSMTVKFPLYDEYGVSRIACALVLAEKNGENYSAITHPYYISNPDAVATVSEKGNMVSGIKGFCTEDVYEARLVGADRVLFEARMDKLMLADFKKDAIRFELDGISYYYDRDEVEKLDRLVKDSDDIGMKIYLRTTLKRDVTGGAQNFEALSFLYCKKAKDADGYLPDLSNEKAVRYVKAFYAFLASRYDVSEFIIGERVNDYANYCNAGSLTSDEYETMYSFWARTAYQTVRSVNSSASVIIPVDDSWRIDASSGKIGAKVFLSGFADTAKKGGDYGYGVAVNLCEGNDILSLLSKKDSDLSDIGAENLSDVTKFIESADMRYQGEKRRVIIDGLTLSTEEYRQIDCASYYTAVYYIAAENKFDAFFCSSSPYLDGDVKGDFYYATVMCGTDLNSQLSNYSDRVIKADVPDFKNHVSSKLTYAQSASLQVEDSIAKNRRKLSLTVSSLTPGGGVYDIQGVPSADENSGQALWLIRSDTANGTAAVSAVDIPASDIVESGYIALNMSSDDATHASVIISCKDRTFIGETEISSAAKTYYFDISSFSKNADDSGSLTLSVCFLSDKDGEITAEINDIFLCGSSGNGFAAAITIIAVVLVILLLVGLVILLVAKRKKKSHTNDHSSEK